MESYHSFRDNRITSAARIMLIDAHSHLDKYNDELDAALNEIERTQILTVSVSMDIESYRRATEIATRSKFIVATFGIHPWNAPTYADRLPEHEFELLVRGSPMIGEIGLDYTLSDVSRETQISAFRLQLKLALEAHLPVIIHCRKAFQDLLDIVKEDGGESIGGVLHAFSGSPQMAAEFVKLGFYLSVAGTVTYRNAVRPLEVVRSIPLEHLLLETDAPDMTPEPYRGCPNEPAFIIETASRVAQLKGITLDEVAAVTTLNASRLFRLP